MGRVPQWSDAQRQLRAAVEDDKGPSTTTNKRSPSRRSFSMEIRVNPTRIPKVALIINQPYAQHPPKPDIKRRNTLREFKKLKEKEHHVREKAVGHAIKQISKSKALGPDNIAPIH